MIGFSSRGIEAGATLWAHLGDHEDEETLLCNVALLDSLLVCEDLARVDDLLLLDGVTFLGGDLCLDRRNLGGKADVRGKRGDKCRNFECQERRPARRSWL